MANAVHKFRDRDVKRIMRATQAAGVKADFVIDPNTGVIRVITKDSAADSAIVEAHEAD